MPERPSAREQSLKGFVQESQSSATPRRREIPSHQELFTLAECAEILALSERTVEALVAKGYLRSGIAPGTDRSRRVSRAMLEEYIRSFDR